MPLNLSNGDFTPHIRWMAQTATWQKSTDDGKEIVEWRHAIFDLANLKTGWGIFAEGVAPEWVFDPTLTQKAPKPQDGRDWRRGFKVNVYSESAFDGVREFATTATGAAKGIATLYEQYEAQRGNYNFSKVPVVQFDGATPWKVGKGNTQVPDFKIVEWRDRPKDLPLEETPGQSATPPPQPQRSAYTDHQAPLDMKSAENKDPDDPIPVEL